jgi:nicotinamidase-related amidase
MELTLQELLEKIKKPFPKFELTPGETVLLLIDMQKLAGTDWLIEEAIEQGIPADVAKKAVKDMNKRVEKVLENSKKILEACRKKGIDRIHVKIESKFDDGRDVGRLHKLHNFIVPPGSVWGEFFDEVKPSDNEIVLTKTCSGAFVGTDLDRILRNLGTETLIIIGFYTDQCVETAARDAADIGYNTILVEDACNTLTQELHDNAIKALKDVYVKVLTTDSLLAVIDRL